MGTFVGVTASGGARIKKGKENEVQKLLDKYDFSRGLECQIDNGSIAIWGYEWPHLWLKPKNNEEPEFGKDFFEEFLEELAPFLAEKLVIHAIGNEKCVFPLAAMEIKVTPKGVVYGKGFKWLY
jgi:hypothetical protein